jgi:flagellar motility protein MotE (MotC chaperone)
MKPFNAFRPASGAPARAPSSGALTRTPSSGALTRTGRGRRWLRLLPSVVIVGAAVLALKTSDLIHEAYAAGAPDRQIADLTATPAPANPDYAGAQDDASASAAQVDVLSSLARRGRELDMRQSQIDTQSNILAAAEKRVDTKIAQLKQLQAQIAALLGQRDAAQKAQIAALVKTYSSMKPKDAARIFDTLPDDVLIPVSQEMKSDVLAVVLANMNAQNAQKLTVKLASRLTLPDTADALAPAPQNPQAAAAAAAAPATQAPAAQAAANPAKTGG